MQSHRAAARRAARVRRGEARGRRARVLQATLLVLSVAGCGSLSDELLVCAQIPEGGCPIGRGGSCDDAACRELYDCVDGAWTSVERCAPGEGGASSEGGHGPGTSSSTGCEPVAFDHRGDRTGCTPDLEEPDCPVAAAEACPEAACQTGCEDFYSCREEGWVAVASCSLDGELLIIEPQ